MLKEQLKSMSPSMHFSQTPWILTVIIAAEKQDATP
jgi:hypothetical protein